jgi:pyridoxine/pyridoxamine 5'-phosphate oxidase
VDVINLGAAGGLTPVRWQDVVARLDARSSPAPEDHNALTTWLATVGDDGAPHVTAVGTMWLDETFWFQTGANTRKAHNIERNPRCSIAISVRDADVVFEGSPLG